MLYRILFVTLGMKIDRRLAPLLLVSFLSTVAFSALWSFMGIWAASYMHAGFTTIGIMYALDALAAATTGYLGGRLSDRIGRRQVIGTAWGVESLASIALGFGGHHLIFGIIMVVIAGAASGPGFAATNAMVGDLVPESRHESAYGTLRVISNIGYVMGPPLGGLALLDKDWLVFFLSVAGMGFISALVSFARLPIDDYSHETTVFRDNGRLVTVLRDTPFVLLLLSTFAGFVVYVAYEVVLPIVTVTSYGLRPASWGLLAMIDPFLVVVLQARITKIVSKVSMKRKLSGALVLMGVPFLFLLIKGTGWSVATVISLFAIGEMIWSPASQSLAASLAPDSARGAYMGAFGASGSAAWAIGPLIDLHLRGSWGLSAPWAFTAMIGIAAALLGAAAAATAQRRAFLRRQ